MDSVKNLAACKPLVIFSKSSCCMSHSVKTLVTGFGANATVDELPKGQQLQRELMESGQRPSVPTVYIGGEFVGGKNEIMSFHLKGQFVPLLQKA